MKKMAMVALVLFAFPLLASFATTAAEKPVTGPRSVFTVLNDLPHEDDATHEAVVDVEVEEPEAYEDESEELFEEAWEEEQDLWLEDYHAWDEAACQLGEAGAQDFRTQGVVYDEGTRYTWYSENVLPGGALSELNGNGRTVNDEGFVTDGDGRIAVASSDYPIGTELDTPFGPATVYDTGCPSGTIDVYTNY